jgi:hypothetical protein
MKNEGQKNESFRSMMKELGDAWRRRGEMTIPTKREGNEWALMP